jgi:hypothetical protein
MVTIIFLLRQQAHQMAGEYGPQAFIGQVPQPGRVLLGPADQGGHLALGLGFDGGHALPEFPLGFSELPLHLAVNSLAFLGYPDCRLVPLLGQAGLDFLFNRDNLCQGLVGHQSSCSGVI